MDSKGTDFLSRFLCTVNRKVCYILSVIIIVPLISFSTTLKSNQVSVVYVITLVVYLAAMYVYYRFSLKYKNKTEFKKISSIDKLKFFISLIVILTISMILTSIIVVLINIKFLT